MSKKWIATGALLAAAGVMLGAFAAHKLPDLLQGYDVFQKVQNFDTGVRYQMYHSFAIILCGILVRLNGESRMLRVCGWLFSTGILFFSGSLYLLTTREILGIENWKWLGPVTPLGGLCFITGWILLVIAVLKNKNEHTQN